jgi:hypothetical protein
MAWDVRGYFLPGVHFIVGGSDPQNAGWNRTKAVSRAVSYINKSLSSCEKDQYTPVISFIVLVLLTIRHLFWASESA